MAATGKTPILLYGSTTATNTPAAGNLTNSSDGCEIAINVADKNLFFKDSTNAVNTVPIRQSSASSDGWLSSANWTTFNSKQTAYTNLTSIGSLANATGWLYNNGSGTFSYSTPSASDVGAVPTTRTISTTSPLAGGGDLSANRTFSITQATTSTNGYLSSTDWNTFNNKQPAGSYALTTGTLAQFAATTSAQLAGVISDETGSGSLVFANTPTLITPNIGAATGTSLSVSSNISTSGGSITIGSGGAYNAGVIYSDANWGMILRAKQASPAQAIFRFADSADAECFRVTTTKDLSVTSGNVVIATSGKGIDFSAAASGSGSGNLLSYYEVGTFTPVMRGTTSGTLNLSGAYTRIGDIVEIAIAYSSSIAANTIQGNVYITGLPYTVFNNSGNYPGQFATSLLHIRGGTAGTAGAPIAILNGTQINLHTSANLGTTTVTAPATATFPATNIIQNGTTSVQLFWTFVYRV